MRAMSRALRLLVADGWYHVTARGNERRAIFRGDGDRSEMTAVRRMERRAEWTDVVRAVERLKGEA